MQKETLSVPVYRQNLSRLREQLNTMLPAEAGRQFAAYEEELQQTFPNPLQLRSGDLAPDFVLSDAHGTSVRLRDQLSRENIVLVFFRGEWCPYCNLQLNLYQKTLAETPGLRARVLAISPQTLSKSLAMQQQFQQNMTVLSDPGNVVARQYTTVFRYSDAAVATIEGLGYDFDAFYEDKSRALPVPSVFVIGRDRRVVLARSEGGDYKHRVEPAEIVQALRSIG